MLDANFISPSSRSDFDALLEALDSPHAIISPSGVLCAANRSFSRLFPQSGEFAEGRDIADLLSTGPGELRELLKTAAGQSTPLPLRLDLPGANEPAAFQAVARRIKFDDGGPGVLLRLRRGREGTSVFAELNGQIERLHRRLGNEAHERRMLSEANQDLERFAAVAAHDLRAPLGQIRTMIEVFETDGIEQLSTLQREMLDMIDTASARMSALIEALLEHSRAAEATLEKTPVKLVDVVREAAENLIEATVESEVAIQPGPLPTVACDPTLVRQIFQNLISNAIKFRRDGVVPVIRIFAETRAGFVTVSVSDNGRGFGGADTDQLFRPFSRLANSAGVDGSGIGLATCMSIASRHGWKVQARESDGGGATFEIGIPHCHVVTAQSGEDHNPAVR